MNFGLVVKASYKVLVTMVVNVNAGLFNSVNFLGNAIQQCTS
ncbi:MAG TPA: hypothetical protein VEC37_00910 [Bacillota bacterium]|nr:hypothetical protein [Bacillota bacterium]